MVAVSYAIPYLLFDIIKLILFEDTTVGGAPENGFIFLVNDENVNFNFVLIVCIEVTRWLDR